jgi:tRNA (uracil-5-)-methyltransferase TRM9
MDRPEEFERRYVHEFYESYAEDFSGTRRRPWPKTEDFLESYSRKGHVLLDSGCGNGRSFLSHNTIGLDYSRSLLLKAKEKRSIGLLRGDVCDMPFHDCAFDIVLSVAVIHHLSSHGRRRRAMEEMKRILKPDGKLLLYVWSEEACTEKKFCKIGDGADYFATWHCSDAAKRYYYLFRSEELLALCAESGFKVIEYGTEDQSIYVVLEK